MNVSVAIWAALALACASCAPSKKPSCHFVSGDVQVYIGPESKSYIDLVNMLERGEIDEALSVANSMRGTIQEYTTHRPSFCEYNGVLVKSKQVLYSSRNPSEVGGTLEIYYDAKGRAQIAEFTVMRVAP